MTGELPFPRIPINAEGTFQTTAGELMTQIS
jgi:hypothetical protein